MAQTTEKTVEATLQGAALNAEPERQHQWLQKLIGQWTFETDAPSQPGQPSKKATGSESVRSLGGIWILAEGQGEMPGGGVAKTLMTLGYDPLKKRFVGTWVGSMMTYLWVYDGELDPTERVLTLNSEGPSMTGDGKMAQYQDIIEFKSDDHRTLTARTLDADGNWQQMMRVDYRRTR